MKSIFCTILFIMGMIAAPVSAQKLVIGERPAELKIGEYLTAQRIESGQPLLIEFFYSPSEPCRNRLPAVNELAVANKGRMSVLLLGREERSKVESFIGAYEFVVALDDQSKTFTAFGVQYVPFAVLLDAKGRVVWFGNSTQLNQELINTSLAW